MPLYLKASSSLEKLAQQLGENLSRQEQNVFDPFYIITQTEGMNNWLKMQLAEQLGIAANCRFLKPNDLIHQLYYLLGGRFTEILSPNNLSWLLYKILGSTAFTIRFPFIAGYYNNSGADKDIKRLALAEKMADLFDQYQIYRPAMMREWNKTETSSTVETEWQQYLWMAAKVASQNELPDKTLVGDFILNALQDPQNAALLKARMPAIHLFGLSITTEYHVQILHELSRIIDVHFHMLNPAPAVYWFDDKSEKQLAIWRSKKRNQPDGVVGNALLTAWGRVIQDTFGMFFKYDAFLNAYEELEEEEPASETLLQKIQQDVCYAATENRNEVTLAHIQDGSITFSSCYTIAREVEVLYNYLVGLIDQRNESLSPRDMVVMVSNVDAYAPYIKAVFSNAPYPFRYTIADESFAGGDNLFEALNAVLRLSEERLKAEEVIQLLDISFIRKRFGIQDLGRIREIVDAANIRFGIDGNNLDETRFVSWRYGLQRIMYGVCMSGGEAYGEQENCFFPLDIMEGSGTQDAIRFCHFAEVLIAAIEERKGARDMAGWVRYTERVLQDLIYEAGEEVDEQYNSLIKSLSDYNAVTEWMPEKVAFEVFSRSFLQTLSSSTRTGLYANGGITFCSLIPMRSIPFKVVAMLGMGYDKFPRREKPASFNLMAKTPQRGDRNVKENDKHLFLETVLSARKFLYISYLGHSAKDNAILPPSALVDELLDYIESGFLNGETDIRSMMVVSHPLHGFNPRYNSTDPNLYSYLNNLQTGVKILRKGQPEPALNIEEIQLDELIRFFKNPIKTYYNKVLGVYYNDEDSLLSETEIFGLDHLQKWSFKNKLLTLDARNVAIVEEKAKRTGSLPLSNMSTVAVHELEAEVQPVRSLYEAFTAGASPVVVSVLVDEAGVFLSGTIPNVFDGRALVISWSKNEVKYLVEAYLYHLAGIASGNLQSTVFLSATRGALFEAMPLTPEDALIRLASLIDAYKNGLSEMTSFFMELAATMISKEVDKIEWEDLSKEINKCFVTNSFSISDAYLLREFRNGTFNQETMLGSYKKFHRLIIAPLLEIFPTYFVK